MTTREEYERRRMELADHILAHPTEFVMSHFGARTSCGTTGCIAGNAAYLAEKNGQCEVWWADVSSTLLEPGFSGSAAVLNGVIDLNGRRHHIGQWACEYLGLESCSLFYNMDLTPETAAKALLEEPYVTDEE